MADKLVEKLVKLHEEITWEDDEDDTFEVQEPDVPTGNVYFDDDDLCLDDVTIGKWNWRNESIKFNEIGKKYDSKAFREKIVRDNSFEHDPIFFNDDPELDVRGTNIRYVTFNGEKIYEIGDDGTLFKLPGVEVNDTQEFRDRVRRVVNPEYPDDEVFEDEYEDE